MTAPAILGLCGSLREPSYTRRALERVLAAAARRGAATALLHGAALDLPLCDGRDDAASPEPVRALRGRVREAGALVIGSPEYCGTYSAVTKNLVEWLGPALLGGKPIGVVTVAEGASAAASCAALQGLCLGLGAWVVPIPAVVPLAGRVFAGPESPLARATLGQLDALGAALPGAARRLARSVS